MIVHTFYAVPNRNHIQTEDSKLGIFDTIKGIRFVWLLLLINPFFDTNAMRNVNMCVMVRNNQCSRVMYDKQKRLIRQLWTFVCGDHHMVRGFENRIPHCISTPHLFFNFLRLLLTCFSIFSYFWHDYLNLIQCTNDYPRTYRGVNSQGVNSMRALSF